MTTPLTAVLVDGLPVACADLYAVITHGRTTATGGPTASTATVTVYDPHMPVWTAGQTLQVEAHGQPRFTGTITDVHLSGHNTLGGVFEVTAMGAVATLGWRDVGDVPWPVETPGERATRILFAAGVRFLVADASALQVNAQDVDRREAQGLIADLAADTGAAVFDTPTGDVVFQHYSTRAQTWTWFRWVDEPPTATWETQTDNWEELEVVSPAAPVPLIVDGCAVLWEPSWTMTSGDVVNSVTVSYGPPVEGGQRPTVTVTHPASIARFGRRHTTGPNGLADQESAYARASMILDLHAWPKWHIDNVIVLLDKLPGTVEVMGLLCGAKVQLLGMPQPAPEHAPVRIVEGWTHTLGPDRDTLTLRLSDPAHSYAGIAWTALPSATRWMDVDPAVMWTDVITPDDLVIGAP